MKINSKGKKPKVYILSNFDHNCDITKEADKYVLTQMHEIEYVQTIIRKQESPSDNMTVLCGVPTINKNLPSTSLKNSEVE